MRKALCWFLFIVYTIQSSSSGYSPGGCRGCSYGVVDHHFCNACKVSRYFFNLQVLISIMQTKLYKPALLLFFVFAFNAAFAQKDSIVYKIPTEGDKVVYSGTVSVNNRAAAQLDAASKSWLDSYFKYHLPAAAPDGADTTKLYNKATIEYKVKPGMVNIPFYCQFIIIHHLQGQPIQLPYFGYLLSA